MTLRKVIGALYTAEGLPKINASGNIVLQGNSYTPDKQYLVSSVRYRTNTQGLLCSATGELGVNLWVNSEGTTPTRYKFYFPDGTAFEFVLPPGGQPVQLSQLRSQGALETPITPSVLDTLTQVLAVQWEEILQLFPTITPFTWASGSSLQLSKVPPRPESVGLFVILIPPDNYDLLRKFLGISHYRHCGSIQCSRDFGWLGFRLGLHRPPDFAIGKLRGAQ